MGALWRYLSWDFFGNNKKILEFWLSIPRLGTVSPDLEGVWLIFRVFWKEPVHLPRFPPKSSKTVHWQGNGSTMKIPELGFFHETTGFWKYFSSYTWVRGCISGPRGSLVDFPGVLERTSSPPAIPPKIIKNGPLTRKWEHYEDTWVGIFSQILGLG